MNPITNTAQVMDSLAALGSLDWAGLAHLLPGLFLSVALAWLLATPVQAAIEGLIVAALPGWAFMLKPFLPSIFSSAVAYLAHACGLPGVDVLLGGAALAKATHWVNDQPWAVTLEGKYPTVWSWFLKGVPAGAGKAAVILLALCLGSAALRADVTTTAQPVAGWCAGPALWGGTSLYQTNASGTLDPAQQALGGVEFAGYLGSWEGDNFAPTYTLGILGAMATEGNINRPAVGLTGGFYMDGVPLTVFAAKELTSDAGGLLWGVGTSVKFTGFVPFLYFGKPGN